MFSQISFDFQYIFETDILVVIENLDSSKAFHKDNIQDNKDVCSIFLTNDVNRCIDNVVSLKSVPILHHCLKKMIGRKN